VEGRTSRGEVTTRSDCRSCRIQSSKACIEQRLVDPVKLHRLFEIMQTMQLVDDDELLLNALMLWKIHYANMYTS